MLSQDDRLQSTFRDALISTVQGEYAAAGENTTRIQGLPDIHSILLGFPRDIPLSEYQKIFTLEAIEKTGDHWFVKFGALKRYIETHDEEPTAKTVFEGIHLGTWLAQQKAAYRNKTLPEDRYTLLERLSIAWTASRQFNWDRQLIACKAFLEMNHRLPNVNDSSANGMKIGEWLAHQRNSFRKNKLPEEKIERFEKLIGPVWDPMGDRWNHNFEAYKDYVETTGKQPMKRTTHNGVNLGIWLSRLRQDMDLLSAEKINALNAIGMTWVLRPERLIGGLSINQLRRKFSNQTDDQWLEYWLRFKGNVPSGFNALDRRARRDSERHVSEKERLDQRLKYWLRFKDNIPSGVNSLDHQKRQDLERHVAEKELLIWLDVQRTLYQKGQLSQERQRRIDYLTNYILALRT